MGTTNFDQVDFNGFGSRGPVALSALGGLNPSRLGPTGIRMIRGRVANSAFSAESTYEVLFQVPATGVTAVRVWFAAGQNTGATAVSVNLNGQIRAVPDTTDAGSNGASPKNLAVGATTPWAHAPSTAASISPAAQRANLYASEWITMPITPRTDGGTGSLFAVRVHAAAGQIVVTGDGTQDFSPWASEPTGNMYRATYRSAATDYSSTGSWTNFNSTNRVVASGTPIAGIEYTTVAGRVCNIFFVGDSIYEGQGTYKGGFGLAAAAALNANAQGVSFQISDMAWAGQTMAQIAQNVTDWIAAGLVPDVVVLPAMSPNDIGNAAITATAISGPAGGYLLSSLGAQGYFARLLTALRGMPRPPALVIGTWAPTSNTVNNYGATDALRVAYNASVRSAGTQGGATILDMDRILAGSTDANGQVQMNPSYTSDGIHPNDAGIAAITPALRSAITLAAGVMPAGQALTA